MVARQEIHAGMIHAGDTATVMCESNHFQVVIDGEIAAVVPRTTTSEIHRYKASTTDKRLLTRPAEARVATPLPRSLRITGTVADWESWTDLAFPESGDYVFPRRPDNRPYRPGSRPRHLLGTKRLAHPPHHRNVTAPGPAPHRPGQHARTAHQTCGNLPCSTRGSVVTTAPPSSFIASRGCP